MNEALPELIIKGFTTKFPVSLIDFRLIQEQPEIKRAKLKTPKTYSKSVRGEIDILVKLEAVNLQFPLNESPKQLSHSIIIKAKP